MYISRVIIRNFRNFRLLDLPLSNGVLVVGENKTGKSNFLYALRLLLDPSLPDDARQLRFEDFWDGLTRPLSADDHIEISVELKDFADQPLLLAPLGDYLISVDPMIAKLTYLYRPISSLEHPPETEGDYEYIIFGGDRDDNRVRSDFRRRFRMEYISALRDAEGDLANVHRSPLAPLVGRAATLVPSSALSAAAENISEVTEQLLDLPPLRRLVTELNAYMSNALGPMYTDDAKLGFSATDPSQLLRSLRLLVDGGRRGIGDASTGSANLLYLGLRLLSMQSAHDDGKREHTFLAIEEPEAHLYPHLQRLLYRNFLPRRQSQQELQRPIPQPTTVFMTSHSPHVLSVTPLTSLVLLRKDRNGNSSEGVSTAHLALPEDERADLERYIDVNRGEIVFAKGVILVEGEAETFILPKLARLLGFDLDEHGVSVCSVMGTHFESYVAFLGPAGIRVPYVLLTDLDPRPSGAPLGERRVQRLKEAMARDNAHALSLTPEQLGIFMNDSTFELSLLQCGLHREMCAALEQLSESEAARSRAHEGSVSPESIDPVQFLTDIESVGKGRYAQRLSTLLDSPMAPGYITNALDYLRAHLG